MRRGRLYTLRGGLMLPWPRTPYGYRADPDRPRDPACVCADPSEAATVAALFGWYAEEGRSFMAVVQRLRVLGVRSRRAALAQSPPDSVEGAGHAMAAPTHAGMAPRAQA